MGPNVRNNMDGKKTNPVKVVLSRDSKPEF